MSVEIVVKIRGCDPNMGDFESVRVITVESAELEAVMKHPWGQCWVIGAEVKKERPNA